MTDWNVFTEESPKECWGVSKPKETVNTRDGQPVSVRRGDILLFVTFRPGKPGEISFTGGYPFAGGSTVEVHRSMATPISCSPTANGPGRAARRKTQSFWRR